MVHSVKKSLTEHGDKVDADEKKKIEEALKAAEEALKCDDKDEIEARPTALMTASQKLGEKIYAETQAAGDGGRGCGRCGAPAPRPVRRGGRRTRMSSTPSSRK